MAHTLHYNPETRTVEAVVQGAVSLGDIKEIFTAAVRSFVAHESYLYLADYRDAKLNLSTIEIYSLPKMLASMTSPQGYSVHKLRRAIVIDEKTDDFLFYETVTLNSGQSTKLFYDMDKAKEWLADYARKLYQ